VVVDFDGDWDFTSKDPRWRRRVAATWTPAAEATEPGRSLVECRRSSRAGTHCIGRPARLDDVEAGRHHGERRTGAITPAGLTSRADHPVDAGPVPGSGHDER